MLYYFLEENKANYITVRLMRIKLSREAKAKRKKAKRKLNTKLRAMEILHECRAGRVPFKHSSVEWALGVIGEMRAREFLFGKKAISLEPPSKDLMNRGKRIPGSFQFRC